MNDAVTLSRAVAKHIQGLNGGEWKETDADAMTFRCTEAPWGVNAASEVGGEGPDQSAEGPGQGAEAP